MPSSFPGYSSKALSFFRQINQNNDRDWFKANKPQFLELIHQPTVDLLARVEAKLKPDLPDYNFDPKRIIYRIYRDTRFAKDKTPLKLHYGFQIQHPFITKNLGAGLYFHFGLKDVAIGGGIYMPGPEELLALRLGFVRDEKKVRAMLADKKLVKLMGTVQGDQARKVPESFEAAASAHDLVKRKQLYFYKELPPRDACTPAIEKTLLTCFGALLPMTDWINQTIIRAIRGKRDDDDDNNGRPKRPEPMF
jgi:uncharacterized protein (TIGR02453 family)